VFVKWQLLLLADLFLFLNENMNGMDEADLVLCSLMDFGT